MLSMIVKFVFYDINLEQKTDQSLTRVFLQELKETKNDVENTCPVNVYSEIVELQKNIERLGYKVYIYVGLNFQKAPKLSGTNRLIPIINN